MAIRPYNFTGTNIERAAVSKLMNDLNQLSDTRKEQNNVVVEESKDVQENVQIVHKHKGIYFLSVLVVLLIGISTFSMSTSLKIYEQVGKTEAASNTIIQTLDRQGQDIQDLRAFVMEKSLEGMAQITELNKQLDALKESVKEGDKELADVAVAFGDLKASVETDVEDLKMSNKLMMKKVIRLNDKVEKLEDTNSLFYNIN